MKFEYKVEGRWFDDHKQAVCFANRLASEQQRSIEIFQRIKGNGPTISSYGTVWPDNEILEAA